MDSMGIAAYSWKNLVADYFKSRAASSKDPIDRRPVLEILVQQSGPDILLLQAPKDMICLRRCADALPDEKKRSQPSTSPVKPVMRPQMKKQKLVTKSSALTDMLSESPTSCPPQKVDRTFYGRGVFEDP
jgi:hypothetical protein